MKYASLHCHTSYSNLKLIDSINKVEDLIDYGYDLGLHAIAITDHDLPNLSHSSNRVL